MTAPLTEKQKLARLLTAAFLFAMIVSFVVGLVIGSMTAGRP